MTSAAFLFKAISFCERMVAACRRALQAEDRVELAAGCRDFTEILADLRAELAEATPMPGEVRRQSSSHFQAATEILERESRKK